MDKRKVNFRRNMWTHSYMALARVIVACFDVYYQPQEAPHVRTI